MIAIIPLLVLLGVHWFNDFVCQTHWQATNKSSNNYALLFHTLTYSALWLIPALITDLYTWCNTGHWFFQAIQVQVFVVVTFLAHTATDYFTSRLNTKLWKQERVHDFFVSVGFDQLLHTTQLVLTYTWLING